MGLGNLSCNRQQLDLDEAAPGQGNNISVPYQTGIRIDEAVTINRPREEVFRFWRDLSNIAQFMEHVQSVRAIDGDESKRSHWIAKGPAGKSLEWDAAIINEKENELIAWRSQRTWCKSFQQATHDRGRLREGSSINELPSAFRPLL